MTAPGGTHFDAAPLDRLTRVLTWTALSLVAFVTVTTLVLVPLVGLAVAAAVLLIFGTSWAFAPKGYALQPDGRLGIERRGGGIRWFDATRVAAGVRTDGASSFGLRLWGSGGFLGYYGLFWRRDVGRFRAYLTARRPTVAVQTQQGLVIVSPADPDGFRAALPDGGTS